jgi:hypothetical protein
LQQSAASGPLDRAGRDGRKGREDTGAPSLLCVERPPSLLVLRVGRLVPAGLNRARFELGRLRGRDGLALGAMLVSVGARAQPAALLHGLFQEHAVFQRDRPIEVWRRAANGEPAWSAACFFFARALERRVNVPNGLVHASWGGSSIRPWMSAAALHANGGSVSALGLLALYALDPVAAQSQFGREWERWWPGKSAERGGAEPWSVGGSSGSRAKEAPAADAATGQTAPAKLGDWRGWGVAGLENFIGLLW